MTRYCPLETPIGTLLLVEGDAGLERILFEHEHVGKRLEPYGEQVAAGKLEATEQLTAYFAGERRSFSLTLAPQGTPFQQRVWQAVASIPYGETRSYAQIAEASGKLEAVRAVGAANGRNPLPIVIPCHRVIGSNGSLTGYAGGLPIKKMLLGLERNALPLFAPLGNGSD